MDCTADKAEMSRTKGKNQTKTVFGLHRGISEQGANNSSGLKQTKPTTSTNWQQRCYQLSRYFNEKKIGPLEAPIKCSKIALRNTIPKQKVTSSTAKVVLIFHLVQCFTSAFDRCVDL